MWAERLNMNYYVVKMLNPLELLVSQKRYETLFKVGIITPLGETSRPTSASV